MSMTVSFSDITISIVLHCQWHHLVLHGKATCLLSFQKFYFGLGHLNYIGKFSMIITINVDHLIAEGARLPT